MHLGVPFAAGLSEPAAQALQTLRPTHLERLLPRLQAGIGDDGDDGDEYTLNLPHEHLLARMRGWDAGDGRLPLAALAARGLPSRKAFPGTRSVAASGAVRASAARRPRSRSDRC
jgi:hypothetical protein